MCGICGFVDFSRSTVRNVLSEMTESLAHRGPNNQGCVLLNEKYADIGLGHRRLSILDLSENGNQPMFSEDNQTVIIFNGEVYNFKELAAELEQYNYKFKSNSDTEVILTAYKVWGLKAFEKFIGMFSIVLYDRCNEEIILVRDRTGIKPLYYCFYENILLFGSELKSFFKHPKFKKDLEYRSLNQFLQLGYVLSPNTIFRDTYKLNPGSYFKIHLKNRFIDKGKYWDIKDYYNLQKLKISLPDTISMTKHLLKDAFKYRMISDVPVGVFLSGGYDSSIVTALLQTEMTSKLKTFTIGFQEEKYNEAQYAKKVAAYLGTDHYELYCTFKDAIDIVPVLPEIYDEPFADSSAIPTILLSRFAKEQVTVALSADGGDETFGGYLKYFHRYKLFSMWGNLPVAIRRSMQPFGNLLHKETKEIFFQSNNKNELFKNKLKQNFYTQYELQKLVVNNQSFEHTLFDEIHDLDNRNNYLNKMLAIDYKTYLEGDILVKVDRATMSVSLEAREPLLDHRIIEFAAQIKSTDKCYKNVGKYILKEIAHSYLPIELMQRPKMGFGVPIKHWLKKELAYLLEENTSPNSLNHGIFNVNTIHQIKNDFLKDSDSRNWEQLWNIIMFQLWFKKWI